MTESLLRLTAVLARTGLSRSALYRQVAAGSFPRPIRVAGTAAKAWRAEDVADWLTEQAADAARRT